MNREVHVRFRGGLVVRFLRSTRPRTVAALNHPHICTLFDIGREGETDFLVMEDLDGETLAADGSSQSRRDKALTQRVDRRFVRVQKLEPGAIVRLLHPTSRFKRHPDD